MDFEVGALVTTKVGDVYRVVREVEGGVEVDVILVAWVDWRKDLHTVWEWDRDRRFDKCALRPVHNVDVLELVLAMN